jgi:proline-specific peptidase
MTARASNWVVERYVSEVDAIREALGLKAAHVVGHSWGGTIAAEYAARQPAGLKSLVLQGAFLSSQVWNADARRLGARLPALTRATLERCEAADFPAEDDNCQRATTAFYRSFNGKTAPPAYVSQYYAAMLRGMPPAKAESLNPYEVMWGRTELKVTGTLKDYDAEPLLPRIEVPTLYLSGEFDEGTPEANRRFAARTSNAEVMTIPGSTHSIQYDAPADYIRVLREWLARHDG